MSMNSGTRSKTEEIDEKDPRRRPIKTDVDRWVAENGLTGTDLKIIAVVTMLIDHIAAVFLYRTGLYWPCRLVGRLAFPIFAFLAAEGCVYTRNIFKYGARLLILAVISEIPYDLAQFGRLFYWGNQNVLFTLAAAVLAIGISNYGMNYNKQLAAMVPTLFLVYMANAFGFDYGVLGMCLVFLFYYLRKEPTAMFIAAFVFMSFAWWKQLQMFAITALFVIFFYNGRRGGTDGKGNKYWFYVFYPLHLAVLAAISHLIL